MVAAPSRGRRSHADAGRGRWDAERRTGEGGRRSDRRRSPSRSESVVALSAGLSSTCARAPLQVPEKGGGLVRDGSPSNRAQEETPALRRMHLFRGLGAPAFVSLGSCSDSEDHQLASCGRPTRLPPARAARRVGCPVASPRLNRVLGARCRRSLELLEDVTRRLRPRSDDPEASGTESTISTELCCCARAEACRPIRWTSVRSVNWAFGVLAGSRRPRRCTRPR